eukprot:EG_transcript_68733
MTPAGLVVGGGDWISPKFLGCSAAPTPKCFDTEGSAVAKQLPFFLFLVLLGTNDFLPCVSSEATAAFGFGCAEVWHKHSRGRGAPSPKHVARGCCRRAMTKQ